jgi:hypothetical protein
MLIAIGLYVVIVGLYKGMTYITGSGVLALAYTLYRIPGAHRIVHKTRRNAVVVMLTGLLLQALI